MNKKILVLGGNGFVGRHAVTHLNSVGAKVTIGTRNPKRNKGSTTQAKYRLEDLTHRNDWESAALEYDVILNCVGILRQRVGETYDAIHHLAPQAIAKACSSTNTRYVHVSALGLSVEAKSRFLTSKFTGEKAIMNSGCDWVIVRPSLLDGEGGYGAGWLRGIAKSPIFIVPNSAKGRITALTVEDAGAALTKLCISSAVDLDLVNARVFELGGEESHSFEEYIRGIRKRYSSSKSLCVTIPGWLARIGAHICDLLHFSPFSFGHWELLCKDNVPINNKLPTPLGRSPTKVVS